MSAGDVPLSKEIMKKASSILVKYADHVVDGAPPFADEFRRGVPKVLEIAAEKCSRRLKTQHSSQKFA
jgi:hypothetical protein